MTTYPAYIHVIVWFILFWILIGIMVAIYGNLMLYKDRKKPYMAKRSPSVVFGLNICLIFSMSVSIGNILAQYTQNMLSYQVFNGCLLISWFSILLFLNIKTFIIHFRYKWQYLVIQSRWQQIINPSFVQQLNKNNWYIRTNKKWSKVFNVYKVFGIIHFINFTICCPLSFTIHVNRSDPILYTILILLNALIFCFPFIIYIIIILKTPAFDDIYFIHRQSRLEAKLMVIFIILTFASKVTFSVQGTLKLTDTLIFATVRVSTLFALSFISTFLIRFKNVKNSRNNAFVEMIQGPNHDTPSSHRPTEIDVKLDDVLSNHKTLNLFMNHLSREYSMECLLSYIEFDQFQKYVIKTANEYLQQKIAIESEVAEMESRKTERGSKLDVEDIPHVDTMTTLRNVPQSLIIQSQTSVRDDYNVDEKTLSDVKKKAHLLYNKYIKTGSDFEINLSAIMRKKLYEVLDNKKELVDGDRGKHLRLSDMIMVFEEPKQEMRMLLQYSFTRMRPTKTFKRCGVILSGGETPSKRIQSSLNL